jgi:general secretion pathway protein D
MRFKSILTFLCLLCLMMGLPSCIFQRRKAQEAKAKKNSTSLSSSLDLPDDVKEDSLQELGISSSEVAPSATPKEEAPASAQPEVINEPAKKKPIRELPVQPTEQEDATIEFHFENADLDALVTQISDLYGLTFISDDSISPLAPNTKTIKGHKISFKTQQPLTKTQAWNLFLTFLDIAGFAVIAEEDPKIKRIVTLDIAKKSPLPAFIGTAAASLPNNDQMIRYVYFIENGQVETLAKIAVQLASLNSSVAVLQEAKALVITDKAYNVKSLLNIITELDKVTMPQAMSVLKLRRADAREVEALYKSLVNMDEKALQQQRFLPPRKASPSSYFPENVGVFAEPRTNSLILLGAQDAITRIEDFIIQSVDIDLTQPYSPFFVIQLRYANASDIANIMNEVTKFGANTEAGKAGGVRGNDKYLKPIFFTPETTTNRIIVKGDYDDYLKAKEVITKLDAPQPQVAIEVLLLDVAVNKRKQLGAQIRTREPGTEGFFGTNVKYQTSGLFGTKAIVENPTGAGVNRLLGNLLNLVSTGVAAGNTIISLGDSLNVWAIIQALDAISNVQVLANPFLVATNKTEASVSLGEIRRLVTGTIIGTSDVNTVGDAPAKLLVKITPQINSDGMIVLDVTVSLSQFVGVANPDNAVRTDRTVKTRTIVSDKEVIALGGLIHNLIDDTATKVPILGDIPILGWLFKNKQKIDNKENLLILISARILEPEAYDAVTAYTDTHISDYTDTLNEMRIGAERRDPINRWFFTPDNLNERATDDFIFKGQREGLAKTKMHKDTVIPVAQNNPTQAPTQHSLPKATAITANRQTRRSKKSILDGEQSSKEAYA